MDPNFVTAAEAARLLGISRATLYAYVSRGLVRSQALGHRRDRHYSREDVVALRQRQQQRRNPAKAFRDSLHWGAPILDSAIALVSGGRLYYRGHDAVELSRTRALEEVAGLLWLGDFAAWPDPGRVPRRPGLLPVRLAEEAASDPAAFDFRPESVARRGARILSLFAGGTPAAAALARRWKTRDVAAINAALVLCADHELNVSTFAARCAASARATPYAVVAAGLATLSGARHGGMADRVEAFLDEVRSPRAAIEGRLRRGEEVPGFGHPMYPGGDPRGAALLDLVSSRIHEGLPEKPTIDWGLVMLSRSLRLPRGAAGLLFAIGRTVGWIAHAIEQYATEGMIRPRARYVGPMPLSIETRAAGTRSGR